VIYLEFHQPYVLRDQPPRALRSWRDLVDEGATRARFEEALRRSYRPLLRLLASLAAEGVKLGVRVSGVLLEQALEWGAEVVEGLASLISKGAIEPVAGPYYNSPPPPLLPEEEYVEQVRLHIEMIGERFGVRPASLANPYLAYSDAIGAVACEKLGLRVALAEGAPRVLGWRAPHFVYRHPTCDLRLLVRDAALSNSIAFGLGRWLTAEALAREAARAGGHVVVLGVPAETFGLAIPAEAGAFEFLSWLPREVGKYPWLRFATPSEAASRDPVDVLSAPYPVSWLEPKDLSPLTASPLQAAVVAELEALRGAALSSGLGEAWRLLTQADLLHSASTLTGFSRLWRALCSLRCSVGLGP